MTSTVQEALLAASDSFALNLVAKTTLVSSLILFATWLARGQRAAVRHVILAAGFALMLLLPIISVVVPPLSIPVSIPQSDVRADSLLAEQGFPGDTADRTLPSSSAPAAQRLSREDIWEGVWLIGAAIFIFPVARGQYQIRRLRRSAVPWEDGQQLACALTSDAGILGRIQVVLSSVVAGPMTCGVWHPVIVFPHEAKSWNAEDLRRAFIHELEHVRRGDSVTRNFARIVCAAYWFHPAVWAVLRKLVLEAERACDDAVLVSSEPAPYADQLVTLAMQILSVRKPPLVAMADRTELAIRVRSILNMRQPRGRVGRYSALLIFVMAAVLSVTLSALRLDAEPQTRMAQVKVKQPVRVPTPVAPADVEFEFASIHSTAPDVQLANLSTEGGEFRAQNVSVRRLIEYAYDLRPFQLSNGPGWINTQRYSIAAKNTASEAEAKLKLRRLLIDRFGLRMNRTLAQRRVYALMIANRARFHPTEKPEEPSHTKLTPAGPQLHVNLYAFSMQNVAASLTRQMEQTVVDETGLSGKFDFEFTMEGSSTRGLDLLSALLDLGLKLTSRRGPVEIYSIESVARPSEN